MLITGVELTNIKSYRHAVIPLRGGTTAIRGHNGAGKSTLVEAIGWALFDTLPYSQQQFVREGERWGQVTITFVSAEDDREYQVVRRAGSGANWYVYDQELDHRPAEQKADVVDFLRRHLRVEGEIALDALFNDALGVPQGTLTADFLLTPTNRKKKFDALLQVEEFSHAFERLRDTRSYLQDALHAQELEIGRLERETEPLDTWRAELIESRARERALVDALAATQRQLAEALAQRETLAARERAVKELERARDVARVAHEAASSRDATARAQVREAEEAAAICSAAREDHRAHAEAQAALTAARQRVAARDKLLRERAQIASALAAAERDLEHARARLEAATAAERRVAELAPRVAEQQRLVTLCEGLRGDVKRLEDARAALAKREDEGETLRRDMQVSRRQIAEIEALRPEAALLDARRARVEELRAGLAMRAERERRLTAIATELEPLPAARDEAAQKAARATLNINKLVAQQSWLERLPELEAGYLRVSGEIEGQRATLAHHEESRAQSAGGQCPILHEPCLNIRQKGLAGLDTYFDSLIERDRRAIAGLEARLDALKPELDHAREVARHYERMDLFREQHEQQTGRQREVSEQIASLEAEREQIAASLASLGDAAQLETARAEMEASAEADRRQHQLGPLQDTMRANERRLAGTTEELEQLRQRTAELRSAPEQLGEAEHTLKTLGNPQADSASAQGIARDRPAAEVALRERETAHAGLVARQAAAEEALGPYAGLDDEVAGLDAQVSATAEGHARYLQHIQTAQRLPERRSALEAAEGEARQAAEAHMRAAAEHARAAEAFDPAALIQAGERVDALNQEQARATEELKNLQGRILEREASIKRAEGYLDDLRAARAEHETLGELAQMLQLFRDTIKEAGPYVMQALLRQISTEANRIFGEILGDRSSQLSWQDDYEIVLRSGGQERHFAQLSGGEQMSAALAVRLALLRSLTRLDIAFFDEPTQNMDDERRTNLAEQLRRVHGFDQLIVISHDDTFEQGLDSVVHLEKRNGETVVVTEDALVEA